VRLTIWQFLGIVLALVAGYCVWAFWGKDQDTNKWIRNFNSTVTDDPTTRANGTTVDKPGGDATDSSGEPLKNPW
jgi:hypothetical protein